MSSPPRRASHERTLLPCSLIVAGASMRLALLAVIPALVLGTTAVASSIGIDHSDSTSDELIIVGSDEQVLGISTTGPATGIYTGTGNDSIINRGEVGASSDVEGDADAIGVRTEEGDDAVRNDRLIEAQAKGVVVGGSVDSRSVGVMSGTGSDVIENGPTSGPGAPQSDASIVSAASATSGDGDLDVSSEEGADADASTTADAAATGIQSGEDADEVTNGGELRASAEATAGSGNISVGAGAGSTGSAASSAAANTTALDGGAGDDRLVTTGAVTAESLASAGAGSIIADLEGGADGDASTTAQASATAIEAGDGSNEIESAGELRARAEASAGAGTISVAASQGSSSDISSAANAASTGIAGGSDADLVTNTANVLVESEASAGSGSVAGSFEGDAMADASSSAEAASTGLAGGGGDDTLTSAGESLGSHSVATSIAGSIAAGTGQVDADVSSRATATSAGIDAGEGSDVVTNAARVAARAESSSVAGSISAGIPSGNGDEGAQADSRADAGSAATSTAVGIAAEQVTTSGGLTASSEALSVGGSVAANLDGDSTGNAVSTADAAATGIAGSDGVDSVSVETEAGSLVASARAESIAGSIAGSMSGNASAEADSVATASARGIDTGAGADSITNRAAIVVDAEATSLAGSLGVAGSDEEPQEGEGEPTSVKGAADSSATASASGIAGGNVMTLGVVAASAKASAAGGSLAGNLDGDAEGSARSTADATTTAIAGSSAADTITIEEVAGSVSATASAESLAGSVAGGKDGSASGQVDSTASATAKAVDGDGGEDTVTNRASIVAQADAVSIAGALGVSDSGDEEPADSQADEGEEDSTAARGDASSRASTSALGIEAGNVTTLGGVVAVARSTSVGGSLAANLNGDAEGTASSSADATASAIRAEEDAGSITIERSAGSLVAIAHANSVAGSLAGGKGGSANGKADSSAEASATTVSSGNGTITNRAAIVSGAEALSVAGAVGVSVADEPEDEQPSDTQAGDGATAKGGAESRAIAHAVGIEGQDIITLGGVSTDANATSVAGSLAGNTGGDAEGDAISSAQATATGIRGAGGTASIRIEAAAGSVTASASADSVAGTIAGGIGGSASGNASSSASASAKAVDSGAGSDTDNDASIIANAHATSGSGAVGVSIPEDEDNGSDSNGANEEEEEPSNAKGQAESTATALATGIEGGGTRNGGDIAVRAEAESGGGSIGANLDGSAAGSAASTAGATSIGVAGSANAETLESSRGAIRSDAVATSGSATIAAGVGGEAAGDASSTATANALGIDAGDGSDTILGKSAITAKAVADSGAGTLSASVPEPDEEQPAASALAVDLPEEFDDYQSNVKGSAASTANASAVGIAGADGDDQVDTSGPIDVRADATSVAVALSLNVTKIEENAGVAGTLADASSTAETSATGIDGGAGDDDLHHDGSIFVDADSEVVAVAASLGVTVGAGKLAGGGSLADGSTTARSTATGLQGSAGNDELSHAGDIEARADSDATAVAASLQVTKLEEGSGASGALARSTTRALATARGMDAGSAADSAAGEKLRLINSGTISSDATADGVGVSVSLEVTLAKEGGVSLGGSMADSTVTSQATADGIRGSAAAEEIENQGDTILHADADATSVSVAASVGASTSKDASLSAGAALADATATAEANAAGLAGGAGDDRITNVGSIATRTSDDQELPPFIIIEPPTTEGEDRTLFVPGCSDDSAGICASSGATSVAVRAQVVKKGATLGASLSDTTSRARATAVGLDGGAGTDVVTNQGDISLRQVRSDAHAVSVSVTVAGASKGLAAGAAVSESAAHAEADATGVDGGEDDDTIVNMGSISTDVASRADSLSVSASLGFVKNGATLQAAISDSRADALATTTGLAGGEGVDTITQESGGDIDLEARAEAETVAVTVAVAGTAKGLAAGVALADSSGNAEAVATGIDGGVGGDSITNHGSIRAEVHADADATSVAAEIGVAQGGVTLGAALADTHSAARASATGIAGGEGGDTIRNEGQIDLDDVGSNAEALSISVSVHGAAQGFAAGAALTDATANADASAVGIDGGAGEDTITNHASISTNVHSTTDATSVSATFTVAETGVAVGVALADANSTSTTRATGIDGGGDDDHVTNHGAIHLDAAADGVATSVGVAVTATVKGGAVSAALSSSRTTSEVLATGLEGGAGRDTIVNTGTISIGSNPFAEGADGSSVRAQSEATSVSVTIAGAATGVAGGAALSDSSTEASVHSRGIGGGSGNDEIITGPATDGEEEVGGEIEVYASSVADVTTASANLSVTGGGVAAGAALARARAESDASAIGIAGGALNDGEVGEESDDDLIISRSLIDVAATSDATSRAIGITIAAAGSGTALGGALTDGSAEATAEAAGIDAGAGADRIANSEKITARSQAGSDTLAASFAIQLVAEGVAAGGSLSKTESRAAAVATGIEGGTGADQIDNDADLGAEATADADAVAVSVSISGALKGVAAGAAAADASAHSSSRASGIASDAAGSQGEEAEPDTSAVAFILSDASVDEEGMLSFEEPAHAIDAEAHSYADATSVSISGSGSIGMALGAAAADSSATAEADAYGIHGGVEDELIANGSTIQATSVANAHAGSSSVAASGAIGISGGSAVANASAFGQAEAVGIHGSGGGDQIVNAGQIDASATVEADADSAGTQVSVALGASVGAAVSDSSVTGSAIATAIGGGAGDDEITNFGPVTASSTSTATASSDSLSVNFTLGVADTTAESQAYALSQTLATGIDGGSGRDTIATENEMTVSSTSTATGTSNSINIGIVPIGEGIQEASANGSSTSDAAAQGIAGGDGDDDITAAGSIEVTSHSSGTGTSRSEAVGYTLIGGSSSTSAADSSTQVLSASTGVAGGAGEDTIQNEASLSVSSSSTANAKAESFARSYAFIGSAKSKSAADTSASLTSEATGIDGGADNDEITNRGDLAVLSESVGTVVTKSNSVSKVSFIGNASAKSAADASAAATAVATGVAGGEGQDTIVNEEWIDVVADAHLDVSVESVSVASASFGSSSAGSASDASSSARAASIGIAGGADDDIITSSGSLRAFASATTSFDQKTVSIADSTDAHASNDVSGEVSATGLAGGAGNDTLTASGLIFVETVGDLEVKSLTLSSDGPATSDARTLSITHAAGLDGGADDDSVENHGTLFVRATPHIKTGSRNYGSKGSNLQGRVGLSMSAEVKGIAGGTGDDRITNEGDVVVLVGRPDTSQTLAEDLASGTSSFVDTSLIDTPEQDLVGRWMQFSPEDGPGFLGQVEAFDSETGEVTLVDPLEQDLLADSEYVVFDFGDESPDIEAVAINVGGRVFVDASRSASIHAVGIDGGEGQDDIENTGSVQVKATNEIEVGDYTVGEIDANLSTESEVSAIGIAGNAAVTNQRLIDVEAGARVDSTGFTWSYGGSSEIEGRAQASAAGVQGGERDDSLVNLGAIATRSSAEVSSKDGSVSRGAGSQALAFKSSSDSVGASLGAGDDIVTNSEAARIEVTSSATGAVEGVAETLPERWFFFTWKRSAGKSSEALHHAGAVASGLGLGDGADTAWNQGKLEVFSEALADATARSVGAAVTRVASADAIATSSASGIHARAGEEWVLNQGAIAVQSRAVAAAEAEGSDVVGGDDLSKVSSVVDPGDDEIVAFIDEASKGATANLVGKRIRFPGSDFPDFVTTVTKFEPTTGQYTLATGPDGASISEDDVYTLSLLSEDATEDSKTFIDSSRKGEDPGEFVGQWITFEGTDFDTQVTGFNDKTGEFTLDEDLPKDLPADTIYTLSTSKDGQSGASANSFAHGVRLGDGDALVENESTLAVRAFAKADTTVTASSGSADVGAQSAARAWGIETGNGDDRIVNLGVISVESDAEAQATRNGSLDEDNTTRISAARGIDTGTGNDEILNEGTVFVVARTTDASAEVSAIAVLSGPDAAVRADDDLIVNQGSGLIAAVTAVVDEFDSGEWQPIVDPEDVEAEIEAGTPDVAIRTGVGSDTVALRDESRVVGRIELGANDDVLLLAGEARVRGGVDAGEGSDAIRLEDTGSFQLDQVDAVEHVLVDRGSLEIAGDLILAASEPAPPGGEEAGGEEPAPSDDPEEALPTLRSEIHYDGYGNLAVEGSIELIGDTEVEVVATPRIYEDEILEVLQADAIVGDFATESLPADSALVSFDSDYVREPGQDLYRVLIDVEPFEAVAEGPLQRAVARYLEAVAQGASPGLAEWIGSFQLLAPDADFDTAFASLSPEQYDATTLTGLDTQREYMRGLNRRMDALRARRWLGDEPTSLANLQFTMAGSSESVMALAATIMPVSAALAASEREATYGVWLGGLGQFGNQDPSDGFSGFDYSMGGGSLGIDRRFGEEFIGGLNVGYAHSNIEQDAGRGNGKINAVQASIYGTWFRDGGYVEWVLGYARQSYDNHRRVVVDPLSERAISEHDANVFGAALGGGYRFDVAGFGLRPFASLYYLLLDEEGFDEIGAGAANLMVNSRKTNSLVSELGLRAARGFDLGKGKLAPYLSAAWKYDYDIDDRTIVSGLAGAPGTSFPLDGRTLDQNAAMVGAGLLYFRGGWSASLEYLGEFRGDYMANGIFGRLGVSF